MPPVTPRRWRGCGTSVTKALAAEDPDGHYAYALRIAAEFLEAEATKETTDHA